MRAWFPTGEPIRGCGSCVPALVSHWSFWMGAGPTPRRTVSYSAVYGEGAMMDRMCQKWFATFHAGDFSLDNTPQLGRFVKVGSDQIQTLTENNQCSTMWEIANILKISKSTKLLVTMKNVSLFYGKNHMNFLANRMHFFQWCPTTISVWTNCRSWIQPPQDIKTFPAIWRYASVQNNYSKGPENSPQARAQCIDGTSPNTDL